MAETRITDVRWSSSSPNIPLTFYYDYKRSGTTMMYKIKIVIGTMSSSGYFGYNIRSTIALDGVDKTSEITIKNNSPSQWSSPLTYESDWLSVTNKTSGSTSLVIKMRSNASEARNVDYGPYALTVIPSASTLTMSKSSITMDTSVTFTISKANPSYYHVLKCSFGGPTDTIVSITNETTIRWTPSSATYASRIPTQSSGRAIIELLTYDANSISSSHLVGSIVYICTLIVPDYTISDPSNVTISLSNENPTIDLWDVGVKGYTALDWTIRSGASKYSNYIKKYTVTLIKEQNTLVLPGVEVKRLYDGGNASGITDTLTNAGTFCLKLTLQDSRDKIKDYIVRNPDNPSIPLKITIYDYEFPKVQGATAVRCTSLGVEKDDGTYLKLRCSGATGGSIGGRNGVVAVYQVRDVDEYWGPEVGIAIGSTVIIPSSGQGTFSPNSAYEVLFKIRDTIGNDSTKTVSIPLGKTDFNLTPYGAGFGRYHDSSKPNTIQSDWDLEIKGKLVSDYVFEYGTYGNWNYCKWVSGKAELWGTISVTPQTSTASGTLYYSDILYVTTPFAISNCITTGTADNLQSVVNTFYSVTNQNISFRLLRPTAIQTGVSTNVRLHVIGTWN